MCGGPSGTQMQLQQEEADFYANQIQAYNTAYTNFSQLQSTLNAQFQPILQKGPGQFGYTPQENTALETQANQGTATRYAQAATALNEQIAARGGGNDLTNINSGGAAQLSEELASGAAATQSAEELGITQSGYDIGRQQYQEAVQGEEELAAGWNPNSFAGSTVNAGNAAASEANTITQQQNSMWGAVIGALGGVAGSVVGENPHNVFG